MKKFLSAALLIALAVLPVGHTEACTNVLITRGASKDGSNMIAYSADSQALYGELYYSPAATYPAGTMLDIYEWDTGKYLGQIPQVESTYTVMGNMNEHQLIIGESTFGGRHELGDTTAIMDYGSLIYVTLQRAKTAREAISVIADLANNYGYYSSGESFSIADKDEVWYMELIGKGMDIENGVNKNKGMVWVAKRIPDGYISSHANQARITTIDFNDPENNMCSPDVVSFAREKGYFKGKDSEFSFCDAYAPLDFGAMRFCEARVWSAFNILGAEDMGKHVEYALGTDASKRMPLYVKPKEKVDMKMVADVMRDHYEDTPLDMRNDIGAGADELPYRWRPLTYEHQGKEYFNERAIATQQTGWWFVAQSRPQYDDMVGGIVWFGVDDAATSPLTPIYVSSLEVPEALAVGNGSLREYSETAAFWIVSRLANFAYMRYNIISKDIREAIDTHERDCMEQIKAVDAVASEMMKSSPERARRYLTDYTLSTTASLYSKWKSLDQLLLMKYVDGYVKKVEDGKIVGNGNPGNTPAFEKQPSTSDVWKDAVVKDAGERLQSR